MIPKNTESAFSDAERRSSDRKKLIVDVNFNGGDTTGIANTRDIGIGGLYLTVKTTFEVGTLLFMKMTLGETEVGVSGVVVYSDPGQGVGIRFHNLNEETETLLKKELGLEE